MTDEKKRGRPSQYSKAVAERICKELAEGKTLREVCAPEDMPPESTVRGWVVEDRNGFFAQYTRAREIGYHSMADELLEISDNGENDWMQRNRGDDDEGAPWVINGEHVQRSRLRVDSRKWLLSKALPKIYGEKVQAAITGADGGPLAIVAALGKANDEELEELIAHLGGASGNDSGG